MRLFLRILAMAFYPAAVAMMGHLIGDKKAVNITVPAGDFYHGDLYRITTFSGFLINDCLTAATDRARALEIAQNRSWKIKMTAAISPAVGDLLYWTAGAGTKRGDTDLTATPTGNAVVKCVSTKNTAGYVEVVLASLAN